MGRRLYNGVRLLGSGPCLDNVERLDMGAMPMFSSMMSRGMQVDLSHFATLEKTLTEDMDRITEQVKRMTNVYCNLDSPEQVSKLLFKTLGLKQARRKFTRSGDRESTDYETLIAIQHDHEVVPKILEYKEYSKLRGTYVVPMPKLAQRTKHGVWRMFPKLGLTRVPSGRPNCKEPNLLAMPSRTSRGREIRDGFITDPGWTYVSVDESQIEVRVAAHNSGDPHLTSIYQNEEDIYSDFSTAAFALPDHRYREAGVWKYPTVDKTEHRYPSKTCVLAAIYDVSAGGLLEQMPVVCATCKRPTTADKKGIPVHDPASCRFIPLWTEGRCQDVLNAFYLRYPGLLADRRLHHSRARKHGYIWDMWGRLLHVAAVRSVHPWVVSAALRETGNFPYQGGANGTIKLTMAAVQDDLRDSKMLGDVVYPLLMIHDELLFEAREDVAQELAEHVTYRFETCADLRVPIKAGGAQAATWGSIPK